MSHDPVQCPDCREWYDPGGSEHECPGSARDQADRIDQLERELHDLERDHAQILRALAVFSRSRDFDQLKNILDLLSPG